MSDQPRMPIVQKYHLDTISRRVAADPSTPQLASGCPVVALHYHEGMWPWYPNTTLASLIPSHIACALDDGEYLSGYTMAQGPLTWVQVERRDLRLGAFSGMLLTGHLSAALAELIAVYMKQWTTHPFFGTYAFKRRSS